MMEKSKISWPSSSFDAIRILSMAGTFNIESIDSDQVELEGEFDSRLSPKNAEPVGRWLPLRLWARHGHGQYTLRLPRSKAWVVDVSAGKGEIHVKDIRARLRVMVGKGEIELENCHGVIALAAGKGEVKAGGIVQEEMPARPPLADLPPGTPFPPMPDTQIPTFFGFKQRGGKHRGGPPWMIAEEEADAWSEWGEQFGEQASAWAEGFVSRFLNGTEWPAENGGVGITLGSGDVTLEEIDAESCTVHLSSGDLELDSGRIRELALTVSHGDIAVQDVMPLGEWSIEVRHGDINLTLPAEAKARIDAATRHGDIDSDVPLVRVSRPGPGARHGARMVGTTGDSNDKLAEIGLVALSGDVEIKWRKGSAVRAERPVPAGETVTATAPSAKAEMTAPEAREDAASGAAPQTEARYSSQLAVLEALSKGEISVTEAETLLRSLR